MMRGWVAKSVVCLLALAFVADVALARHRFVIKGFLFFLPGVDPAGNLSGADGADGVAKFTYNTRNRRATASARGRVRNRSGHRQEYDNVGVMGTFIAAGTVKKDKYTVARNGHAHYDGVATNATL